MSNRVLERNMDSVRWLEDKLPSPAHHTTLLAYVDNSGSEIAAGIAGDFVIHFPAVITGWTMLADQPGDMVIDIWKTDYVGYPPTVLNTIITPGGVKPTLSGAIKNRGFTATGDLEKWDLQVSPGDTFRFNVDSINTITRLHFALAMHKPPKT